MKWPPQCVLNVPHFLWTAITPTSPGVNSEIVGPIGYLLAMMWHSGHSFSLGTGYNLHSLNFPQQQAIKQKLCSTKKGYERNMASMKRHMRSNITVVFKKHHNGLNKRQFSNRFETVSCLIFDCQGPQNKYLFLLVPAGQVLTPLGRYLDNYGMGSFEILFRYSRFLWYKF